MKSFATSKLHPGIIKAINEQGIIAPTEIQAKAIPLLLTHNGDFVGRSATGTGKTFAFAAPLLSRINTNSGTIQAVILVPTRELCEQIGNELIGLAKYIPELKIEAIYGGVALKTQINDLSNGTQVIVATPGRLVDLVNRKVVKLEVVKHIIFDEADEMLLKGFATDIDKILATANKNYTTWLFSATMPDEINSIIKKYLNKKLEKVAIGKGNKTNKKIEHQVVQVIPEEKLNVLLHFLTRFGKRKGIIFCRTKSGVQKLYKQLSANKFSCGAIHGDLPQGLRNKVMEQYKANSLSILIATDVASRGVDVIDIGYVIHYHIADTKEAYTHRSGRTSRAGKTGISLMFSFPEEKAKVEELDTALSLNLEELPLPSVKDQLVNRAILWGNKIAKEKPLGDTLDDESKANFKEQLTHLSKDEILEKLLATYLREQQG